MITNHHLFIVTTTPVLISSLYKGHNLGNYSVSFWNLALLVHFIYTLACYLPSDCLEETSYSRSPYYILYLYTLILSLAFSEIGYLVHFEVKRLQEAKLNGWKTKNQASSLREVRTLINKSILFLDISGNHRIKKPIIWIYCVLFFFLVS